MFMFRSTLFLIFVLTCNTVAQTGTTKSPVVTEDGTIVVFPDGYRADGKYPVVYLLPYTGGTAAGLLSMWAGWQKEPVETKFQKLLKILYPADDERQRKGFIAVLPPEKGHLDGDGSWDGFQITIDRWEKKIKGDLATFIPTYGIDPKKVVVAGFSLGGDLSWALPIRNPDLFAGAVVMGSHCSYGWDLDWRRDQGIAKLGKNGFRFVLTMGENEDGFRVEGFNEGKARLEESDIAFIYKAVPNKAHHAATPDILKESLDYILWP